MLIGPHSPSAPVPFLTLLHAMQVEPHAVSQQKLSTQLPLEHWFPSVQAEPFPAFATQAEPVQKYPDTHCASVVHAVKHAVAPQRYGLHPVTADWHVPNPLQLLTVWLKLAQVPDPQLVPAE